MRSPEKNGARASPRARPRRVQNYWTATAQAGVTLVPAFDAETTVQVSSTPTAPVGGRRNRT